VSLRDRLDQLSRGELAGLAALLVVVLGGAGLWYSRSLPRQVSIAATPAPSPGPASPSPAVLIVDVAGWVRHPGVYEFHEGDRVIDAVEAAGGPRKGAYLAALNLAAPLADGQQVLVPKEATAAPAGATPGGSTLVNVNLATAAELETLPGIGEVIAAAIVEYRERNGPFATVDQLEDVSGIGPATLEEIRDLVTV
jgi:competence protein ComEA